MNLLVISAIIASISVLGSSDPWHKKTVVPTMPPHEETPSPTPVDLDTSPITRRRYPGKKTPSTLPPVETTAHHEETTVHHETTISPTQAELDSTTRATKRGYPQKKTTVHHEETTVHHETTISPTQAELDSTTQATRRGYPQKTHTPDQRPTPTIADIDTVGTREPPVEESTVMPETPVVPEVTEQRRTQTPARETPAPTLPPVDFDCRQKSDGYYPDPKDKCSSRFFACVGGLARQLNCSSPDLVYEPESNACERRQDSFRCTGIRKTTLPSTPRRPPPPPPKLFIDCSKLDDGWYPDPEKKCSHVFYSCSNGIGHRFDCPGNMYYDKESNQCHAFQDVVSCAGKRPPTTPRSVTTIKPPVTEKLPINCLDKASGLYPDPSKKCSNIYYVCSNGDGFKRSCPPGLYYDAKKQLCDYYDEIFECSGKVKPVTKPTSAPKPSPASLPSSEFDCKNKADGSYTPVDKKCSNIYFRCVGGNAYKLNCPAELYYDKEHDWCDRWFNLFVCSGRRPTSPAPTTTTKPKPTEKLPIDCSSYEDDGDFPDPEKKCSNIYYTCSNSIATRRKCPDGLYFDKDLYLCDAYNYVMDCSGKPRPSATPAPSKRPVIKHPYNCERLVDGNYEAGKCLDYYWSCVGGTTIRASCPHGTMYDSEYDQCGYRHEIPACGGVRPTKKP